MTRSLRRSRAPRVYMMGGDKVGWALDAELSLTRQALTFVRFSSPLTCHVVHSVSWPAILRLPGSLLHGKRVIAHLTHDPEMAVSMEGFDRARRIVTLWVVRSRRAKRLCDDLGLPNVVIPYMVDHGVFRCLGREQVRCDPAVQQWGLPTGRYLIGSFQRDTEGHDLRSPKLVKGPDVFADIVQRVHRAGREVHVVLAGPRRFWLRRELDRRGVPYTFLGQITDRDDLAVNNLDGLTVNKLYNLIDLYVVASRKEGGPQAVLEAAASECKILSSDVGHAGDFLAPQCIFPRADEAAERILSDLDRGDLDRTVAYNRQSVERAFAPNVAPLWRDAYDLVRELPAARYADGCDMVCALSILGKKLLRMLDRQLHGSNRGQGPSKTTHNRAA